MNSPFPTLGTPAYFFPNQLIWDVYDPNNIDPSSGGATNNRIQWSMFYLPFNITISRYRMQIDVSTWTTGVFYAGLYTSAGALVCDIGAVSLGNSVSGQYGKGAAHDPGTNLFDASGTATNAVYLPAGWYIYAWAASVASGVLAIPSMQPFNNTVFGEQIVADTTGLPSGIVARAGTNTAAASGSHLPATVALVGTGVNTLPPNITFFA